MNWAWIWAHRPAIVVRGKGIVLSEPAYVAYDRQTRNVVAVGEEARRMYGRTPAGLIVERPLRDGRIRSFDLVSKMLRYFLRKVVGKRATFRPKLLLALPGGMAPSERQTLVDVIVDAGVRSVVPVDEGVASAIGAGMRIDQPYGRMNIDIGGGRTNVSVFSFGHQIVWDILNVGGDRFDDAIIDYLRKKHNLLIGARTAEELKIDIGSARMRGVKLEMDACGRSLVSGLPRAVTVSSEEMIEALDEPLRDLMSALHRMIERTPPELASDIFDEGITLSGGGAQLFGLDGVISDQLKIRTTLADEPDLCVAHGLSELIDDEERYENIDLVSGSRSDLLGTTEQNEIISGGAGRKEPAPLSLINKRKNLNCKDNCVTMMA
ncbi:MAG: rod shape-determining protein [Christensenellales bacterium]